MTTREYAKNLFSTWSDDDFCAQPIFDKLLFQVLNGQRTVNTAGVFPINYTRLRKAMRDGDTEPTEDTVREALARLEQRRYVFIDEATGEGLIRSRVRRDELDKQPTVLLAALRIMAAFDSPKFASVMRAELDRIDLPVIASNSEKANALRNNLKRAWDDARHHLQTLSEESEDSPVLDPLETLSRPSPEGIGDLRKQNSPETLSRPSPDPLVSVSGSVSVSNSPTVGGHVGGDAEKAERPHTPPSDEPPPDHCPKHPTNTPDARGCGPCGGYRRLRERWDAKQTDRRTDFWTDVANCPHCDTKGWLLADDGTPADDQVRCPQHDWAHTHA